MSHGAQNSFALDRLTVLLALAAELMVQLVTVSQIPYPQYVTQPQSKMRHCDQNPNGRMSAPTVGGHISHKPLSNKKWGHRIKSSQLRGVSTVRDCCVQCVAVIAPLIGVKALGGAHYNLAQW